MYQNKKNRNKYFNVNCNDLSYISSGRKFNPGPSTLVEIDHEIIYTVILLPSAESFKKSCCQLQAKVCARNSG